MDLYVKFSWTWLLNTARSALNTQMDLCCVKEMQFQCIVLIREFKIDTHQGFFLLWEINLD